MEFVLDNPCVRKGLQLPHLKYHLRFEKIHETIHVPCIICFVLSFGFIVCLGVKISLACKINSKL